MSVPVFRSSGKRARCDQARTVHCPDVLFRPCSKGTLWTSIFRRNDKCLWFRRISKTISIVENTQFSFPLLVCAPPFPLLCGILGITIVRPTNSEVFSAPTLLPKPASLRHCGACQSTPPLFFCAARPRLAPAKYLPSTLHTRAHFFQWVVLTCFRSIFFTSRGQTKSWLPVTPILPSSGWPEWRDHPPPQDHKHL